MDNVNHPAHYEGSTSIECIEATETRYGEAVKTALDGLKNRLRGNNHVD